MKLTAEMIKLIAQKNLEMLFSKDAFTISVKENEACCEMLLIFTNDEMQSATFELRKRKHDTYVVAASFMTKSINYEFQDLVKCCKGIEQKLNEFADVREIFYMTEDVAVTGFSEIGIDYLRGSRRDLIVNRDEVYSVIKFDQGKIETFPIEHDDVREVIEQKLIEPGVALDFCAATLLHFVDPDIYCDSDDD